MAKTNTVVKPVMHNPKGFVNVAASSDKALKALLVDKGIEVPKGIRRHGLISLLKDAGLWNFDGNVVPVKYKAIYGKEQRCGDEVSEALHSATRNAKGNVDIDALRALQADNNIDYKKWEHLNVGQQVMNTSNVLRARYRKRETIVVAGVKMTLPDAAE